MVYELLIQEGVCVGALGIDAKGRQYIIHAKAVIIATGGNAQLFSHNVHPSCCTADGYAMALRAGASLMNLEFMQIFTATVTPTRNLVHTRRTEQLEHLFNREHYYFSRIICHRELPLNRVGRKISVTRHSRPEIMLHAILELAL